MKRLLVAGPLVVLVRALVAIGEVDRARDVIVQTAQASPGGHLNSPELCTVRFASGLVELASGDPAAALSDFYAYRDVCEQLGHEERNLPWRLGAARAKLALGDRAAAAELADEALARARNWAAPGELGVALRVQALVGDWRERCRLLADAVRSLRESVCRLELAGALVDHGVALRAAGRRRAAHDALEEAMDIAARCEAHPLVAQALGELHVLGARPRRLMFSGLESLTASERRVAAMALGGHTNREIAQALFVTQKTVENHLSNAYRKLDIKSRRELPSELDLDGIPESDRRMRGSSVVKAAARVSG
jgi:DNA-binding CsgD family transcriptional regulator